MNRIESISTNREKGRVLIVDDEKDFVLSLTDILASRGYQVEQAYSEGEAQKKIKEFDANVVLLDVRLGRDSGLDLVASLKKERPNLLCVVMTAYADTDTVIQALHEGAYDYLRKPLGAQDLLATLDRCFDRLELEKQKREAEEVLKEREQFLNAIFENIPNLVWVKDAKDLRFLRLNMLSEKLFGFTTEELAGKTSYDLHSREDADNYTRNFREVLRTNTLLDIPEETIHTKSGERIFSSKLVPILDDGGEPQYLLGISEDITETKRAEERAREHEEQLFQAAKMVSLGTLVSGVAHEINNPNNFIRLSAENLADFWEDITKLLDQSSGRGENLLLKGIPYDSAKEMIQNMLNGLFEGSKRIENLVKGLKEYARKDDGEVQQIIEINPVVESSLAIVRSLVKKSTSRFTCNLAEDLPAVKGNYHQIEQVIINLVTNACQALENKDQGVSVTTRYEEDSERITVLIQDEGVGIPKEDLLQIADPFFTTKRDIGGTGLGLSVSYRIVKNHGGELTFSSEPGKGTSVYFKLPCYREEE